MADDMGYADLGCYGSKRIKTPNIDRLATEGVRFLNHYAGTTVCAPSRCSLMTGLTTGHCQVRGNMQWEPYGQVPLAENTVTVASKLKEAGYQTALIGKWGLGVEGTSGDPLKQGFDYMFGYLCQVLAHNHCPEYLMENGQKVYLENKVIWTDSTHWTKGLGSYPIERKQFSQELFTQKAIEFIETNQSKPFFLYFPVVIPHDNGQAPKGKKYSDIPSFAPYENEPWTESEKGYAAMITYLDNEVGKIMDKLKALGLDENTLIIFTSDNGDYSPDGFSAESSFPFRGHKRDLYEGGIRVPFIARWAGKIAPDSESSHVSAFWDFLPTACELAGIQKPEEGDGISYLPELLGKKQQKHASLYFEFHEDGGKQAIIKDSWKCIRLNLTIQEDPIIELYNLKDDIREQNNLASQFPEKVTELVTLMEEGRTENDHFKLYYSEISELTETESNIVK
jgi:arylsulfatase A-like enzyme